jgi:hypothetical protein
MSATTVCSAMLSHFSQNPLLMFLTRTAGQAAATWPMCQQQAAVLHCETVPDFNGCVVTDCTYLPEDTATLTFLHLRSVLCSAGLCGMGESLVDHEKHIVSAQQLLDLASAFETRSSTP